jgi:hypothetical protein
MKKLMGALLSCVLLLQGCGHSEKSPATLDYAKQFAINIPAYWEIADFNVEATENVGNKVEPMYQARFKATVKLKTRTYEIASREDNALFIRPMADKGEKREIYGRALAELSMGNWKINFSLENNPIPSMGQPKDFFIEAKVIVVGTPEESEYRAQIRQERGKALKTQQLEEERQHAEQEKRRIAEEGEGKRAIEAARRGQEAHAAKAEAEKVAVLEKHKAKLLGRIRSNRGYFIDSDKIVEDGRGHYRSFKGRNNVYVMSPIGSEYGDRIPAYIELECFIPANGASLVAEYANWCDYDNAKIETDFVARLVVIDNNEVRHVLNEEVVSNFQGWVSKEIPLDAFSNQFVRVRLEDVAGGSNSWNCEFCAVAAFYVLR